MGLIYGSGSFTRFTVEGEVPENYLEDFPRRITRFAFRNIDETSEQERSFGWVNIMDMFDSRLGAMEYLKEPCIAMSWRVDAKKVPAKALKQYCREAEERIKDAEGLEFVSKKRRQEIKEGMKMELMRRAIPRSQTYDMLWNLQTSAVIFGSINNKLCDEFAGFFQHCFDLHLKTVFPYSMASQILEKEGMDPALLDWLQPSLAEVK
ncbi:MAG: recombination-associated protein RdgC [Desulfobacterales bacterium]|nr:recombination-associated protein RdgC [Desulfobacterales bacterium]